MMETHQYEVFNAKQEEDGNANFKNINSTLRNLYALNRGNYNVSNIANWICEHPRSGTGLTGANLKKAFTTSEGTNMGRGYLTVYSVPVIKDPLSELNPEMFCFTVELDFDSEYAYALLGFLNSAEDNVSPGISKKLSNLVSFRNKDETSHVIEYKMVDGILYMYVDSWYTGQYLDVQGQTRDVFCAFYMGSASSSYDGIVVKSIRMEPLADVYPSTYLASNIDVWVTDKVKNGTGVTQANLVAPHVNEDTARMNAGRGYCVYMSKGIINPYNQPLLDRFTLSCRVYFDDGVGQEILFGELTNDGTDIGGTFKTVINDICDDTDHEDSILVEYRCLNAHAYLFVNGKYTGRNREMYSINYMLGMYNNKALTSNDGVEMNNITIRDTCNLYPFQYQIMNLNLWQYAQYTGSSSTNLQAPSLVNGAVDIGGGYYTYLNAPIRIEDNADYRITFTFTGNYQRIGLGRITFVNDKIRPTGIDQPIINYLSAGGGSHRATFKVYNKVAYLFFDGEYSGVKYDFSNETYPIFIGFYDNNNTTGIQVQNIEAFPGTLSKQIGDNLLMPPADLTQWKYIENSSFFSTTSGEQIRAVDNMIYTARYKFNIFKVPLNKENENEYIVEFRKGSHAYIGITNDPNTLERRVSVHVTEENGFDESGSTNTLSISFRGSSYYLSNRGGFVDANNLPPEFGDNVYLIVYQNNSNDRMIIERIYENVVEGGE